MGHSIQLVGERHEIFKDADLIAFVYMLRHVMNHTESRGNSIERIITKWRHHLIVDYGPGTIDLNLQEIADSRAAVVEFQQLLDSMLREISQFGAYIPASTLNDLRETRGVRFQDYPTEFLTKTIERVRGLIKQD